MKHASQFTAILMLAACFFFAGHAAATSWADLPAEEVVDRADLVVLGVYDIERGMAEQGDSNRTVFTGYRFVVERVYKGQVSADLTAGIDFNDIGLVSRFQSEGGRFLLFLEETERSPFPIPVGGPNGMLRVSDNRIVTHDADEASFFQDYLDERPSYNPLALTAKGGDRKWFVALFILSGSAVLLFGYRIAQMRRKDTIP